MKLEEVGSVFAGRASKARKIELELMQLMQLIQLMRFIQFMQLIQNMLLIHLVQVMQLMHCKLDMKMCEFPLKSHIVFSELMSSSAKLSIRFHVTLTQHYMKALIFAD